MQASRLDLCSVTKAAQEAHLKIHDVWASNFDALDIDEQLRRIEGDNEEEMLASCVKQNGLEHALRVVFGEIDCLQPYTAVYSAGVLLFMTTLVSYQSRCHRKSSFLKLFTPEVAVKLAGLEFRLRRQLKRLAGNSGLPFEMCIEIMPHDATRVWNSNLVDCVFATEVVLLTPNYCQDVAMEHMLALIHMSKDNSFVGFGVFSRLLVSFQRRALNSNRARSRCTTRALDNGSKPPVEALAKHRAGARWKRAICMQIKQNRMDRTRTAMNRVESRRREIVRNRRRAEIAAQLPPPAPSSARFEPDPKRKAKHVAKVHVPGDPNKRTLRKLVAQETLLVQADKKRREQRRQDELWCERLRCLQIGDEMMRETYSETLSVKRTLSLFSF